MSTLVALSSTMAYTYSFYALIAATARAMSGGATGSAERNMPMDMKQGGGNGASNMPMFDMPAMLLTFIVLGKWLESIAKERTTAAISALKELQPPTALVVDQEPDTGVFCNDRAVASEDLCIDDLVRVRPGEVVPGDGEV